MEGSELLHSFICNYLLWILCYFCYSFLLLIQPNIQLPWKTGHFCKSQVRQIAHRGNGNCTAICSIFMQCLCWCELHEILILLLGVICCLQHASSEPWSQNLPSPLPQICSGMLFHVTHTHCQFVSVFQFLPLHAMHQRGLCCYAVSVRLFVCPSLCRQIVDSVKTNKRIFKIFPPYHSHAILVFLHQTLWQYSDDRDPCNRGVEFRWGRHKS